MIDRIAEVARKRFGQGAKPDKSFLSGNTFQRSLALFVAGRAMAQGLAPSLDGTPITQSRAACSILSAALPSRSNSSGDFTVIEVVTYGSNLNLTPPTGYLLIGPTPAPSQGATQRMTYA